MILVSGCLLGINCKYNGGNNLSERVKVHFKGQSIIPFCPEQLGGLTTPRAPAEIQGGDGLGVLKGKARIIAKDGSDVTDEFIKGAHETLRMAQLLGVSQAVLKARSPSCGVDKIYDGSFSGKVIPGDGVTAALLKEHGIKVYTEENFLEKNN